MKSDAQNALNELLEDLKKIGAYELVENISTVISRGATQEAKTDGRDKELSQRAFLPTEAYLIAIYMLIASLEPLLMQKEVLHNLHELMDTKISINWCNDYVEESPIKFENVIIDMLPELDNEAEEDIKNLLKLIEDI